MSSHPTLLKLNDTWGPCPPDGFRYVFPEDGYIVHAWTYVDWLQSALNHLQANEGSPLFPSRIERPELEGRMQDQLCRTLPPGWCMYDDPGRPRPSTVLSWNDVASGLKTFARWLGKGAKFVEQPEAERRAVICTRCYLNVNVQGCSGCQKAVSEIVGDRKTKHDDSLRSCAVCRCFLKAKVHFPIDTLDTTPDKVQEMYPDHCWLNKQSPNYNG